ncbi:MAG: rhomboid family intramembrane serine protease [Alphaproteobacteria bacterium]|nr:rhomboid family intramembrane serine protease [Alphaproteobacteria bacterium]MBU0796221.1 rhomboid family intramembrane serine protease [Alphaproteobacteria bacterium]MBU0888431.1 rhomboid family intramembrane serine protease [Alphaproteobacteria bacterium]MBU1813106.1 rhomboid family intramembrane serine protease [Alphaproteobacteria bacterium]
MIPINDDNPTERFALVTLSLMLLCGAAFLWQVSLGEPSGTRFIYALGLIPSVLLGAQHLPADMAVVDPWMTVLTSMFLHGGWLHLGGNMLYLWIFGNNVEEALGRLRFLLFYLLCGAAAAALQVGADTGSVVPMIGASGAISGVLGAYLMLFPRANVWVLLPLGIFTRLTPLPAIIVLGFYFVLQLISALLDQGQEGGVAWYAHIGGFVAGVLLVGLMKRRGVPLFGAARPRSRMVRRSTRRSPWGRGPWG